MDNTETQHDEADEFSLPWSLHARMIFLAMAPLVIVFFSRMEPIDWACAIPASLGFGALAIIMIRYPDFSKLKHPFATPMGLALGSALVFGVWLGARVF